MVHMIAAVFLLMIGVLGTKGNDKHIVGSATSKTLKNIYTKINRQRSLLRVRSSRQTKAIVEDAWDPRLCPEVAIPPCFPESTRRQCQNLVNDGCVGLLTTRSCPAIFFCGRYQNETQAEEDESIDEGTDNTNSENNNKPENEEEEESFTCPSPNAICMNKRVYKQCKKLIKNKCKGIGIKESCPVQFFCIDDIPATTNVTDDNEDESIVSDQPSTAFIPQGKDESSSPSDVPSLSPSTIPSII